MSGRKEWRKRAAGRGGRIPEDIVLNHSDVIVEGTKARRSSWGCELYFRKITLTHRGLEGGM